MVEVRRVQCGTLTIYGQQVTRERIGRADHDGMIINVKPVSVGVKAIITECTAIADVDGCVTNNRQAGQHEVVSGAYGIRFHLAENSIRVINIHIGAFDLDTTVIGHEPADYATGK